MIQVPSTLRAGVALAALTSLTAGQQASQNAVLMDDLVRGQAAVERIGPALEALAAKSEMTTAAFAEMVRLDDSIHVDASGNVLFIDPWYVDGDAEEGDEGDDDGTQYRGGDGGNIPLSEAFNLASRPSSNYTIYIDFTGHHSVNNGWGHNIVFPAYNTSGSSASFSNSELQQIIDHWRYMAEDFAIFDVNVTTIEPPVSDLRKSGFGDTRWGVRDVHTQATDGFGNGIGGVAFLGSFTSSSDTPVFSFNKGSNNGSMTGSHEVGHALGLSHDGLGSSSYHPGTSAGTWTWGPIMGAPFGAEMVHWSNGDYPNSTQTQNDANIIASTSNGTTLIPDDHGAAILGGTMVGGDCPNPREFEVCGLITWRDDLDSFTFWSDGGFFEVDAFPPDINPNVGNLDIKIELFDPAGVKIVGSNPTKDKTARIARNLGVGLHTLRVDGGPQGTQYSDYGSRGHYTLDFVLPGPVDHFTDLGESLAGSLGAPVLDGNGYACEGDFVSLELSNAAPNSTAFLAYGPNRADLPLKGGVLVPNMNGGGGYLTLPTTAGGTAFAGDNWPTGLPPGFELYFQYWIIDSTGPQNFTASNAAVITVP